VKSWSVRAVDTLAAHAVTSAQPMKPRLTEEVGEIMRDVAREIILPRRGRLEDRHLEEKTPGEFVTAVDREAERIITTRLKPLLPGSIVVGEEQAFFDPASLTGLAGETVWLVDPLDGTSNFAAGDPSFAVMVALLQRGETVAAWLLDPLRDVLSFAGRGAGAFTAGERIRASPACPSVGELRGAVLTGYLPSPLKEQIEARGSSFAEVLPGMRCAGLQYPAVATNSQNFVLFWRTLPWDHAPGSFFLEEAGGHVARLDGSPYRLTDDRKGLLAAENASVWNLAQRALIGKGANARRTDRHH
jgi:fructose-1,6-bisphosphatase/inositol monophosphatase family enzyme